MKETQLQSLHLKSENQKAETPTQRLNNLTLQSIPTELAATNKAVAPEWSNLTSKEFTLMSHKSLLRPFHGEVRNKPDKGKTE